MKKVLILLMLTFFSFNLFGCIVSDPNSVGLGDSLPQINPPPKTCKPKGGVIAKPLQEMFYSLIGPITTQVTEISRIIFNQTVLNPGYKHAIKAMLILYITIYGIMFTFGLVQASTADFVARVLRIGILLTLTSGGAFKFFNDYLFKLFVSGSAYLLSIVTNPYCDAAKGTANFFSFFNYVINNLFTPEIILRLISLIVSFPIGWLCFVIFIKIIIEYLFAIIKAIIAYLFCFTAVALLIALGPIFMAFILFERTRSLFNNWMKGLIMFSLQPVILFASIFFITSFVNQALYGVLKLYTWQSFISISPDLGVLGRTLLFDIYWYVCEINLDYFSSIIILYLLIDLLKKLPDYADALVTSLVGGQIGIGKKSSAGAMVNQAREKITQNAKGLVGKDKESVARKEDMKRKTGAGLE